MTLAEAAGLKRLEERWPGLADCCAEAGSAVLERLRRGVRDHLDFSELLKTGLMLIPDARSNELRQAAEQCQIFLALSSLQFDASLDFEARCS